MNRRDFAKTLFATALTSGLAAQPARAKDRPAMTPTPFKIAIPDAQLADLKSRLQHTRWPDEPADSAWMFGTSLGYMKSLTDYWLNQYDWRKAEDQLNALPNYKVAFEGIELHFVRRHLCFGGQ